MWCGCCFSGRSEIENIFENMCKSRKVMVVLSRHYLNAMNLFELDLATRLMYEGTIQKIILIYINNGLPLAKIPKHLVHTMRRNQVLEWADNAEARELVKHKIIELLATGDETAAHMFAE